MNKAEKRALALLKQCLSPEQLSEFKVEGGFYVQSSSGKTYRIEPGTNHNLSLIEDGERTATYCAGPQGVPWGDYALAQKLWLENDEDEFLKVANRRLLKYKPSSQSGPVLVLGRDDFRVYTVNISHQAQPIYSFEEFQVPVYDGWEIDIIGQAGLGFSLRGHFNGPFEFKIKIPNSNGWLSGVGYLDGFSFEDIFCTEEPLIKCEIALRGHGVLTGSLE